jgi:hypothetical protein
MNNMFYFKNLETNQIVTGATKHAPDGFLFLCEAPKVSFPKAIEIPAVEAFWFKEGEANLPSCPQINDDSWTHLTPVAHVPKVLPFYSKEGFDNVSDQPMITDPSWDYNPADQYSEAYWSKLGEDNTTTEPKIPDTSWTYNVGTPEVVALPDIWVKDEQMVYVQPMMNDPSWSFSEFVPSYIVIENDEVKQLEHNAKIVEEARISVGKKKREFGVEIIDYLHGFLEEGSLTVEQAIQINTTFNPIIIYLERGALGTAASLISSVTPDAIFTQTEKDFILAKIQGFYTN